MTKRIATEWESYQREILMPAGAGQVQVQELRRAFYAGVLSLKTVLTTNVSTGKEVKPADMLLIEEIDAELEEFYEDVKEGIA